MTQSTSKARVAALAPLVVALAFSLRAVADDVASFATGGFAAGLRTKAMMHIMDADGDGTISRTEWDAYQEKVFGALDTHKRGRLNATIFAGRTEVRLGTSLATGGYARGLASAELAHKIDADGDGWISHEEWMTYQGKIFDMMNTSVTHHGSIGAEELFAAGGPNRR